MDCGIPSIIAPWIKIETKTVDISDEIKKALRKTKSVKHETKTLMLKEIIENYRVENPNKQAIGFQEVRKILQEKYGVKCRSIGNLMREQLKSYATYGGNKNKKIKIN